MIRIRLQSDIPIYRQIVDEVRRLVDAGELKDGDALPTIRALASQLDVAVNTIARAYQELETEGLAESRGSRGTFIRTVRPADAESEKIVRDAIRNLLQRGWGREQIEQAFRKNLALFFD